MKNLGINEIMFASKDRFPGMTLHAIMENNLINVFYHGTDEAVESFMDHVAEAVGGRGEALDFARITVSNHNVKFPNEPVEHRIG